jgi:hypothetical protein
VVWSGIIYFGVVGCFEAVIRVVQISFGYLSVFCTFVGMERKMRLIETELAACEEELSYLLSESDEWGVVSDTDAIKRSIENCCRVQNVECSVSITQTHCSAELSSWSVIYDNIRDGFKRSISLKYFPVDDVYKINGLPKAYRTIAAVAYCIVVEYPNDICSDDIEKAIESCCEKHQIQYSISIRQLPCLYERSVWSLIYDNIRDGFRRSVSLEYFPVDSVYKINGLPKTYRTIAEVAHCIVEEYPNDICSDDIKNAIESCCKRYNIQYKISISQCPCLYELSIWSIVYENVNYRFTRRAQLKYYPSSLSYTINDHSRIYKTLNDVAVGIVVSYDGDGPGF